MMGMFLPPSSLKCAWISSGKHSEVTNKKRLSVN